MHPQLSSARLYIAQQRSAVPCLALRFAVLCCAALCVILNILQQFTSNSCSIRYDTDTKFMYVFCVLVFLLSSVDCPLSVPMRPPPGKYRTYCRSKRDINKHTAQRRAISSAQAPLCIIINSLFAPNNHGPLLPAPFIYMFHLVASFLARA